MKTQTKFAIGVVGLAAHALAIAAGQTSTSYAIPRDSLNASVGNVSSASYRMSLAVGDSVATTPITSVSYRVGNTVIEHVTNPTAVMLNLLTVVSRKLHGATPFNLTIDATQPLTGTVTVEPRTIGAGHTLVFHFDRAITSVTAATALDSLMSSAGTAIAAVVGGDVEVTLTNVTDNKRLTVTLSGLNGTGSVATSIGFLVGDVNNTRSVTAADISGVKARSGQTTTALNFQFDLNASGAVSASDISAVKARSGLALP